ncbi:NfeD family protein [Croceibacterium sp. LX-88]|jgi:membrane protein implicated in regulation of membrane protease activity|uniref:NfeD family protein n=1 Tax=Croceibacterium selenioxidans TaxID=2838833 RepID=A0ABS5W5K1_9SPHN|nr:NfeD family protein [Croceibacterium selenioxidans]MBT2135032.1 NfeD family protein [Croceibacterium selenioxidans]
MDWLNGLEAHWVWLTLGLVLAGLEMLVPGVYLIWLAVAAIVTGAMTAALDLSLPMQVVDFVFLSLIVAFSAKRFLGQKPIESTDPLMNRRGARLVGETALVVQAIEHGSGRVKLGDSEWIARGPDVAKGERVRIRGTEGSMLLVEPVNLLGDEGTQPAN